MTKGIQIRRVIDDNRIFIDMPDSPDKPCTACRACCAHFRVSFYCGEVAVGFVPTHPVSKLNNVMACMKEDETGNGRCVTLIGKPGKSGISCSIYPNRPTPCREFAVWLKNGTPNPDCQRLQVQIGLPPLHPLPSNDSIFDGYATISGECVSLERGEAVRFSAMRESARTAPGRKLPE